MVVRSIRVRGDGGCAFRRAGRGRPVSLLEREPHASLLSVWLADVVDGVGRQVSRGRCRALSRQMGFAARGDFSAWLADERASGMAGRSAGASVAARSDWA